MATTMTNQEWIEYYRFHPSEFKSFINYVETEFIKKDDTIEELRGALENLLRMTSEHPAVYDGSAEIKTARVVLAKATK